MALPDEEDSDDDATSVGNENNANPGKLDYLHNIAIVVKNYCFSTLALIAVVLSVCVYINVSNEVDNWKKSKELENSLKDEINSFSNSTNVRIILLAREIKSLRSSLINKIGDLKSSLDAAMVDLRQDLINVQNDVSGVTSDLENVRASLGKVKDSMEVEKSRVWAEFSKLEKEIKNLPKSRGNNWQYVAIHHPVIVIIAITILL